MYCGPAFAFGGVTFPFIAMTLGGKIWSTILPLPYFLEIVVDQAVRGSPCQFDIKDLVALLVFILIGITAAFIRLKYVLINPYFWKKA